MVRLGHTSRAQRKQFLAREIANPATIDQLADAVTSQQEGVQVYTAARIAVDPDLEEEHEFLGGRPAVHSPSSERWVSTSTEPALREQPAPRKVDGVNCNWLLSRARGAAQSP